MRKIIACLCAFFLVIILAAQVPTPSAGENKTISLSIETPRKKRICLSEADDKYLNKIDSRWSELLNQTLLYNNYSVDDDASIIKKVSPEILKKRLQTLNDKTPLDIEYNDVVQAYINRFLKMGKWIGKIMGLAEYYFPLFEEKLSKYDIPLEIKYLAIIESALNPRAGSNRGAIGLWQFIYPTAKMYGLKIDSYVDERMDPLKSTEAACQYLERHYKIYGDWNLVLAAYNSGAGNVNKAIRRSGGYKNYWNIRRYLPLETQGYIPSFIAMTYLFEYARQHNLKPKRLNLSFYDTDTVFVKNKVSFAQLSRFTHIPFTEIEFLNPQYKNNIIPREANQEYVLRLPRKNIDDFIDKEDSIYLETRTLGGKKENSSFTSNKNNSRSFTLEKIKAIYQVKQTETIDSIAKVYNVSPSEIRKWNNLSDTATIDPGDQLTIFRTVKKYKIAQYVKKIKKTTNSLKKYYHTVRRGESLVSIAKRYRVYTKDIRRWNHLKSNRIRYGVRLVIYTRHKIKSSTKRKRVHTVRSGESLGTIAKKYHVFVSDIKKWNRLRSNLIKVGQKLVLYSGASSGRSSSKRSHTSYHTVKKGESLISISKKYHVSVSSIKKWNRLRSNMIRVGKRLLIKK